MTDLPDRRRSCVGCWPQTGRRGHATGHPRKKASHIPRIVLVMTLIAPGAGLRSLSVCWLRRKRYRRVEGNVTGVSRVASSTAIPMRRARVRPRRKSALVVSTTRIRVDAGFGAGAGSARACSHDPSANSRPAVRPAGATYWPDLGRRQGNLRPMSTVAHVTPMLATPGRPPVGPGWAFEIKWDGVRAEVAALGGGKVRLTSRNDRVITHTYPDLAETLAELLGDRDVVLDCEIVALGADGYPDIQRLQGRMNVQQPAAALVRQVPVSLMVFDVLYCDGGSTLSWTYQQRRKLLAELDLHGRSTRVQVPPSYTEADCTGAELLDVMRQHHMEGIVSKRLDGPYEPGRRRWIKTALRTTAEVVVCGWRVGKRRALGALMMGAYGSDGKLYYLGDVGSGFTGVMLDDLLARLTDLEWVVSPFGEAVNTERARWVHPVLVGEVAYRTRTRKGLLRYPAWRMLRTDKAPAEVVVVSNQMEDMCEQQLCARTNPNAEGSGK